MLVGVSAIKTRLQQNFLYYDRSMYRMVWERHNALPGVIERLCGENDT